MHTRVLGRQACRDMADLSTLMFLSQAEQVDCLERYAPELLQTCRLVALTLDVRTKLLELGRPCHVPWDELRLDELHRLRLDAEDLMRQWFLPWESCSRQAGIDIPFIDHETQKWFFREALLVRELARRLFSRLPPVRRMIICGPLFRPSVYYYASDTLGAVTAYIAESSGIEVTMLCPPGRSLLGRMRTDLAALARAFLRRLPGPGRLNSGNGRYGRPVNDAGGRPTVGVCIHGLAFHAELVKLLSGSGYAVIVFLLSELPRHAMAELGGDATIVNLSDEIASRAVKEMRHGAEGAWSRFTDAQSSYSGQFSEILANPYLDFHFRHYFLDRWPRIAAFLQRADRVLEGLALDCFITSNLTDTENWALCEIAKRRKIPLLIGLHSGWPDPEALLPRADGVMLWSESQRKHLANRVAAAVSVTGALGYDDLRSPDVFSHETGREEILQGLGVPPRRKVILLLTANVSTGLFPVLDVDEHLSTLAHVFRVPDDLRGEVHILVKTKQGFDHPRAYEQIRAAEGVGDLVTIVSDVPLEKVVTACDAVLLVNIPTTAYLDAIFRSKPVLFISTVPIEYCGQPQMPDEGISRILTAAGIWPTVRRLLLNPPFREEILRAQRAFHESDMPLGQARRNILEMVESACQQRVR